MSDGAPKTLLVAVDYEPLSALAFEYAVGLARQWQVADLHCVHVAPGSARPEQRASQDDPLTLWMQAHLTESQGVRHLVGHSANGDAAEQIVQLAADLEADWVVVGTHGRRGLARALMGSVAERVARTCGCSVLVVREKHHKVTSAERAANGAPGPSIAPPCPRCVETRQATGGSVLWCEQHRERHGRRHTYYDPRSRSWSTERLIK